MMSLFGGEVEARREVEFVFGRAQLAGTARALHPSSARKKRRAS